MLYNLLAFLLLYQTTLNNQYASGITGGFQRPRRRIKRIAGGDYHAKETNLMGSVVSIRSRIPSAFVGDNHFCTGTIITEIFVLTSARCVHDEHKTVFQPRELLVVAGAFNRLVFEDESKSLPVKFLVTHQNFTTANTFDIALLRLVFPIPEYHEIIDIVLPGFDPPDYGSTCTVMGWGRLFEDGPMSDLLLGVDVILKDYEECASIFKSFQPGLICAAGKSTEEANSPCPGDTGGPLFCNEKLQGVVSYTTGCGEPGFPSIFVDTYYYADWIQESIDSGVPQQCVVNRCCSIYISLLLISIVIIILSENTVLFSN